MKKMMMIAALMLMSIGAFAQAGKMGVGVNLGYAGYGDGYSPLGAGLKFQYEFVENVRGEVSGNYWFPKDGFGLWDANLNFHYLFGVGEGIKLYPLAGLTVIGAHGDGDSDTSIGFNIGVGGDYALSDNLKLNLDIKYQRASKDGYATDGPVFQLGLVYGF